jgi:ribosome-associated toxin RatA of RatAB toxin-antitoxin module
MRYIYIVIFIHSFLFSQISLNTQELDELKKNSYIIKRDIKTNTGFISFDVDKNINQVFKEITNLNSYSDKIDDVSKVNIYNQTETRLKATIYIDNFFIRFSNSVVHNIDKINFTVRWHLDEKYKDENYFEQMNGYWKLKQIDENTTRIFYSNNLVFKSWIPQFIKEYLFQKGLFSSTYWLKQNND